MKHLTIVALSAIAIALTGCQGFMGLDYHTLKYGVNSQHSVRGQYLAGVAQGDGKYEIVIGKRGNELRAWVERDGKYVASAFEGRRLFRNPHWPFPKRRADKKGTPQELGLLDEVGDKRSPRWLLHVQPRHRIVSRYAACVAMYGKENVTIATNNTTASGKPRYWIEVVQDGKTYSDPCAGVYREHYESKHPDARRGEWVVQWRGTHKEYQALADSHKRTPEEIAANRAASQANMRLINASGYWMLPSVKRNTTTVYTGK